MPEQSPNPKPGVLVRSGQAWKGIAGMLAIFLGTGLVYWSVSVFQVADMKLSMLVIGTFLAGTGTVYPWLAVRCPSCRDPWLWRAMSRHPHRQWLSWLLSQGSCPKCGFDP
jgi:hypothetical protein